MFQDDLTQYQGSKGHSTTSDDGVDARVQEGGGQSH